MNLPDLRLFNAFFVSTCILSLWITWLDFSTAKCVIVFIRSVATIVNSVAKNDIFCKSYLNYLINLFLGLPNLELGNASLVVTLEFSGRIAC